MAEVHLPHLDDEDEAGAASGVATAPAEATPPASTPAVAPSPHHRGVGRLLLEVLLISTGVFLGLAGEQWRESARHHELARDTLRRFRTEIVTNRTAVAAVKDYHVDMRARIESFLKADAEARKKQTVEMRGIQPVTFEHTAWDLAIATESLTYLDQDLAFELSRVYSVQEDQATLSRAVLQTMYLHPPSADLDGFLRAVELYYDDIVIWEPRIIEMYDALLPKLDRALGA
jgi:hypothetical protein